jgi:tripartite-type tricarboxylate transporter receptor subunit TctC
MKLRRRNFLHLAAGAAVLPALSLNVSAQTYPTRPVRLVVNFTPGATNDILARLIGQWLSERLGQPFVVENRPGAGGNLGTEVVVRALADGYTLLLCGSANTINVSLYQTLSFNFVRDIAPVAGLVRTPGAMVVNPSFPAQTLPAFIAYAKAKPGSVNMASAGIGSTPHMMGELFKMMASLDMVHVPYRGGVPAMTDLFAGQVQVYFQLLPGAITYIRVGKLRALAVTSAMRQNLLPDLPTVAEFVPGYEATAWFGIGAPKNTPSEIIETLNKQINAALADLKMRPQLEEFGGSPLPGSPADLGKLIGQDVEKWAKVIKFAGIKPD